MFNKACLCFFYQSQQILWKQKTNYEFILIIVIEFITFSSLFSQIAKNTQMSLKMSLGDMLLITVNMDTVVNS